eukprot:5390208-Pleurochrysis_carterae.AAC.3
MRGHRLTRRQQRRVPCDERGGRRTQSVSTDPCFITGIGVGSGDGVGAGACASARPLPAAADVHTRTVVAACRGGGGGADVVAEQPTSAPPSLKARLATCARSRASLSFFCSKPGGVQRCAAVGNGVERC